MGHFNDNYLEANYTIKELKEFIKDLPDDMPVVLHSDDKDSLLHHYIKVVNGSKIGLSNPITGLSNDVLLIGTD